MFPDILKPDILILKLVIMIVPLSRNSKFLVSKIQKID